MLLLMLWCDIVANYVDKIIGIIGMRDKQQYKKLSRYKTEQNYGDRTKHKNETDRSITPTLCCCCYGCVVILLLLLQLIVIKRIGTRAKQQ